MLIMKKSIFQKTCIILVFIICTRNRQLIANVIVVFVTRHRKALVFILLYRVTQKKVSAFESLIGK